MCVLNIIYGQAITIVPVNNSPIEEATQQVEDMITHEEATSQVEADIAKVEPEIVQLKEAMLKVEEAIKPPNNKTKYKKRN